MKIDFELKSVYRLSSICGPITWGREGRAIGVAYSVTGKVQANLRGATDPVECDWRVNRADFGNQSTVTSFPTFRSSSRVDPVTRNGVTVEPGCAIASDATWFLPKGLKADGFSVRDTASRAPVWELRRNSRSGDPERSRARTTLPSGVVTFAPAVT